MEVRPSKANLENAQGLGLRAASLGGGLGSSGWGLEEELVCSPSGPVQPPTRFTWDLLLHADAVLLSVALSTDTAVATLRVLTLLVLSWTHYCLTLIHIWGWGRGEGQVRMMTAMAPLTAPQTAFYSHGLNVHPSFPCLAHTPAPFGRRLT